MTVGRRGRDSLSHKKAPGSFGVDTGVPLVWSRDRSGCLGGRREDARARDSKSGSTIGSRVRWALTNPCKNAQLGVQYPWTLRRRPRSTGRGNGEVTASTGDECVAQEAVKQSWRLCRVVAIAARYPRARQCCIGVVVPQRTSRLRNATTRDRHGVVRP